MPPGPRPVPTQIKILNGNPGKRALNKDEPQAERISDISQFPCPAFLDPPAAAEWAKIVPILIQMGVLTAADEPMVINWCILQGVLMDAYRDYKKTGSLHMNKKTKSVTQNPLLAIIARTVKDIGHIASEFGLTPSSRVRLVAPGGAGNNPWNEFTD